MRRLTYLAAAALALGSLLSQPLLAQSGGGGNSRGGGRRPSTTTSSQGSSSSRSNGGSVSRSSGSSSRGKTYTAPQDKNKSQAKPAGDNRGRQPARTGSNVPGRREQTQQPSRPQQPSADHPQSGTKKPDNSGAYRPGGQQPGKPGQVRPGDSRPGNQGQPSQGGQNRPDGRSDAGNRPPQGRPSGNPPQDRPGYGGIPGLGRPEARPENGWRPEPGRNPPPQRDPISYRRPSRFWDSGRHYFGYRVKSLPPRYGRRDYFGIPYYILDDVFYRYSEGSYYVCRPPFGVAFRPSSFAASVCDFSFYFAAYRNYRTYNEVARYLTERNSLTASENSRLRFSSDNARRSYESYLLADRLGLVQSFASASADYYYEDGVFFVMTSGGEYVTVVPPAGALVRELPDDYRTVYLDEVECYAVDYTVYRAVALDGELYFEVLGQMTDGYAY